MITKIIYSKIIKYHKKTIENSIEEIKKSKNKFISNKFSPKDFGLDYETFEFINQDNLKLNGWLIRGVNATKTIVFVHGRSSNKMFLLRFLQMFIDMGNIDKYNIVMFDLRNSGDSPNAITSFGYFFAKDIRDLLIFLKEKYSFSKYILYGFSQGGMAVMLTCKFHKLIYDEKGISIDKIIVDSPISNVKETILDNSRIFGIKLPYFVMIRPLYKFNKLVDNRFEEMRFSSLLGVVPCLFLQSEKDKLTKYKFFEKEYNIWTNRIKENPYLEPTYFKIFRKGIHVRMYLIYRWEYTNTIKIFLEGVK